MGTRADFYVGRGLNAEWLGSIGWDGYPDGIPLELRMSMGEDSFRERVAAFIKREDGTKPEQGWPWPWDDSRTTDYAYAFDGERVLASNFGGAWFDAAAPEPEEKEDAPAAVFPKMSTDAATLGPRSGVIVIGGL